MNDLVKAFEKRKQARQKSTLLSTKSNYKSSQAIDVPKGLYEKCNQCKESISVQYMFEDKFVCKHCGEHLRVRAIDRINITVDDGSFIEKGLGYITLNPLFQDGYDEKIKSYQEKTNLDEAYMYGYARIDGLPCVIGVMDSYFLMGSMGSVVGEKVTRSFEYAIYKKLPIVIFTASGGARMQEGILSLMQMAKTSSVANRLNEAKVPFVCLLTDPTMGGVSASVAWLGDVILAEPGALIGFAGPRVIQETVAEELPEGFQRAEFLLAHGLVDEVVDRREQRAYLKTLFEHLMSRSYRQAN